MADNEQHRPVGLQGCWLWLGYWAALFVVTHLPVPADAPAMPAGGDKVIHFGLYFALAALGGRRLRAGDRVPSMRVLLLWAAVYAVYGVFDEWLQQFVGRGMSLGDWGADLAGVAAATVILALKGR